MNLAAANHKIRMKKHSSNAQSALPSESELDDSEQVELLASLLEIVGSEEAFGDTKKMTVIAVGWLVYCADMDGEVRDLWRAMDAAGTVGKLQAKVIQDRMLVKEVEGLLKV